MKYLLLIYEDESVYGPEKNGEAMNQVVAGHMALDAAKNGGIRAMAFNDAATLTAVGNDLDFKNSFAAPLGWHAKAGDVLMVIEAMKMEHSIRAPAAGVVKVIHFGPGDRVPEGSPLLELAPAATP